MGSVKSNGEDTLSINSILRCQFGGKISILKNGQNGQIDSIEFDRDSMKAFQWGFFTQIFRLNGMSVFESLFGEVGSHYYYQNFPGYGKGKYTADFVGLIESGAIYFGSGSIFVGGWLAAIGTGGAGAVALPAIDSVALAGWTHATMVGGQATAHLFSGEGWKTNNRHNGSDIDDSVNELLEDKILDNDTGKVENCESLVKGYDNALNDFEKLNLMDVKEYPNGTKVGKLPDGRTVNVRPSSSVGYPTIEIYDPVTKTSIKIRY